MKNQDKLELIICCLTTAIQNITKIKTEEQDGLITCFYKIGKEKKILGTITLGLDELTPEIVKCMVNKATGIFCCTEMSSFINNQLIILNGKFFRE